MRLFIGVDLPERVKRAAGEAADALRTRLRAARMGVEARWIAPENHHLTLWFIGEVDDARREAIVTAIDRSYAVRAFTLRLGGLGAFPPHGAPRVLWLGVAEGLDSLTAVYRELAGRLAPLGYAPENRPYSAHLTIARVKDVRRSDVDRLRHVLSSAEAPVESCTIGAVTLFRSRLSPTGARYEPLLRVPLSS